MIKFIRLFVPKMLPSANWRIEILNWVLRGTAFFATIALVAGLINQIIEFNLFLIIFYVFTWLSVMGATVFTRLPYLLRVNILLIIYYLIALSEFVSAGLTGEGHLFLMTVVVLSGIFFTIKNGLLVFLIAITTMIVVGYFMSTGTLLINPNMGTQSYQINNWFSAVIAFTFMTLTLLLSQTYLINKLGVTDKLTQVRNRNDFDEIFFREKHKANKLENKLVLILIDIDDFKKINTNFGHLVGDLVLKQFSQFLKNNNPPQNYIFRWGGEEFIIFSSVNDVKEALVFTEKLRVGLEKSTFESVGKITASFGVSSLQENDTIDSLIERADVALDYVKKHGKNQVKLAKV